MAMKLTYTLPVEQTRWTVEGSGETVLDWNYGDGRGDLLALYDKGKRQQWNAASRIDWSLEMPWENPMQMPDDKVPIHGSRVWERLGEKERAEVRRNLQAWLLSQFLHGEQGGLVCVAKIVQLVPDLDAKFYAATQVVDEARHVEVFSRLLGEKFGFAYPFTPALKSIFDNVLRDRRWDFVYLGTQILVEGLALASFQRIRNQSENPLARAINAYVMQDEARHVAFGRLALRDFYPQLTAAERAEREEFVAEACHAMRDRLGGEEVWQATGLPVKECADFVETSPYVKEFRGALFRRIVPTVRYVGLWGPKIKRAFAQMRVLRYAEIDVDAILADDERIAQRVDAMHRRLKARAGG